MSEIKKRFVLIDGNAIIHRAYHAIPPLTTKDGSMVNAVYGFTSMLLKVLKDLQPTHLAVSFDVAGGTFRDKLFEGYKAKRVKADEDLYKQIPLVHELVEAFQIPIFEKEGYEADDVIGTLVSNVKKLKGKRKKLKEDESDETEIIVVTGDRDLLQLVDEETSVYLLKKGLSELDMYTPEKVIEYYGFPPGMVVDFKALRGDASDNIPGVKGIGEKTATELITKVGGIEEIYKEVKSEKSKVKSEFRESVIKKLIDDEAGARLSKDLATIHCDVPELDFSLEECLVKEIQKDIVTPLFQKFEFYSLLKRALGEEPAKQKNTENKKAQKQKKEIYTTQVTDATVEKVLQEIREENVFSCESILSGGDIFTSDILGFWLGTKENIYEIRLKEIKESAQNNFFSLFSDEALTLVGHDLKQLVKVFHLHGVRVKNRLFDLMIASYVLNSSTRAHDFSSILFRELGIAPEENKQASLFGDEAAKGPRAAEFLQLYSIYTERLAEKEDLGLFEKVEMALIPVLAHMETAGVAIDVKKLNELSKEVQEKLTKVVAKIWEYAGEEFNVASSVQLRDILFEKMNLGSTGIKKGKTGFSTAASELEKLRGTHPIIECIEEHRELAKLQNTYVDVLPTLVHPKTGRIHASFNQAVAATGRLSSSDPNLQNIPIRTELGREIRQAFIAPPGHVLISADYSQIELRIVASLAEDERLMEIFAKGEDVHTATAAAIQNVPLEEVTKEMRRAAKEVNFGVLYGMSAFGLSWRAGITPLEAKNFIKKYFTEFSGVKKYLDDTVRFAKESGYVETLFGRRRYIPELQSTNFQLRSSGERMAVNMPVQGTAADLMKMAMIHVYEKINSEDIKMILQVHDELVLEVKEEAAEEVSAMLKGTMETVTELRVPIEVHVAIGKRWGDLK